jgi:peptide/nickel transport system substrate-binding protein
MSRLRLALTLMGVCSLALGLIGPASARAHAHSKYGGTVVYGEARGYPAAPLDPTLTNGGPPGEEIFRAICQGLYDVDAKGRIAPLLATSLPAISKDKLTYTIPVRTGVLFNDGTPFNAQAVVASLQRDMTLPGSTRADDLSLIDSVTAPDAATVVIRLRAPFSPLTGLLAGDAGLVMSPAQLTRLGAAFATNPVCVGPFMFDHAVVGDNVTVVKSPYYYDKYAVHLDKIVFSPATDEAAAAAALQAGDLQAIDSVSTTQLPAIGGDSGLTVLSRDTLGYIALFINIGRRGGGSTPSPLASNPNVRRAFEEAIDRATLNKVLFGGRMQDGCTPISPASPWFDPAITCTQYDPKDAKRLLAAAGVSGLTIHLLTDTTTDNQRLAQFIQAEEAAVGINVVIDSATTAAASTQAFSGNFDTYINGSPGQLDPDTLLSVRNASGGNGNVSGYSSPRLDLILANARKAITAQARRTLYHAAQQVIANDRPALYLYHIVRISAFSSGLKGVELRPDGFLRVAFAQYR